ncbi:fluoride efflux transporter CrcB [Chlorobium phaeovibrioides]|uniref:Fluoride-specific ion channel FluC n=1 Tax=Chlorobium phaeovibrioides TaxID=1094 RepID=A0A5M8ICV5_CHLPH|nr:fluoride efflux transporter CrcB [Chlorobium phaeovibrioides]KAA6233223.1 fluoride efflux transporter CrcB [Chlorobium phaeovibrioides]MWV54210.1 fluoride efflux transporter CrcB [Chlorobium phaeovibrioides]QEQ56360.1 fluoride efflux transporter CrcB [Chlorobium phaeovibrioides]
MMQFSSVLLAGAGGFLGTVARYLVALAFSPSMPGFPFATFTVNILGSFLIGFISELAVSSTMVSPQARLFLVTGFCGGFTTFSSYMYEGASLVRDGQLLYTGVYLAGSVIGGFAALYSGTLAAKPWT